MPASLTWRFPRSSAAAAIVAAVAGSALAACGHDSPPVTEGGAVAFVDHTSDGGDSAALMGTLRLDSTCLTVVSDIDGTRVLPVFQRRRVSFDGTTLTHDGADFAVGEDIDLGGGFTPTPTEADYIPEGCEYDEGFYVGPRA